MNELTQTLDPVMSPELIKIRRIASQFFIGFLWVLVPIVAGVAYVASGSVLITAVLAAGFAAVSTVLYFKDPVSAMTRFTVGTALTCDWALLIFNSGGLPDGFILDAHMLFFVIVAQLLAYFCWRSILLVSGLAAVHHLVFSLALPLYVWPSADFTLLHFLLHATFVVLVGGPAAWVAWRINNQFNTTQQVLVNLEHSQKDMQGLVEDTKQSQLSETQKRETMHQLAEKFDVSVGGIVKTLSSASSEMQKAAEVLAKTADNTNSQSNSVAMASNEATSNVQSVSSAAEELTASIAEISRQVEHSAQMASNATKEAEKTNLKVQGLAESSSKIGEVVAMITDIAEQTNLLALNATIEAARAGESGKGFAVVASEVKGLASQTASATDDISRQITNIQGSTEEVVGAIDEIGRTIADISDVVSSITAAVEQQSAATQEIALNIEQAASGTEMVSNTIADVTAAASDTGDAASQFVGTANGISEQSTALREEVDKFLSQVRAV
ncbi:MAG: chemotaxis protein [Hyphomicrobiales bacterium]|nr:MAG: chemotaxis protein [Hyphomicrobiales bacterium]